MLIRKPRKIQHHALLGGISLCVLYTSLVNVANAANSERAFDLGLGLVGSYTSDSPFNTGAGQIQAYDPATQRVLVANLGAVRIDVLDIHDPSRPAKVGALDLSSYGSAALSVTVHGSLAAASIQGAKKTDPGTVVFFNQNLDILGAVPVGALPDMLTFTPDGRYVLVANEGEPNTYNNFGSVTNGPSIDPEGSVSVIDLSGGLGNLVVRTATFTAFNDAVLDPSIRIFGPNATVAQDLEPEYITVSEDSTTAWVTLQENNAMATLDIASATITRIDGLGFKDHSLPGNGLDASDQDGGINIRNWPLKGVYCPDGIANYQYRGQTFLVMANEGDTRNYPGFNEEVKVSTLNLDPTAFPNAAELKKPANLGRLTVSKVHADTDEDGDVDVLYSVGGRSFSIRTTTGQLVWDSGDQIELVTAAVYPTNFNASHTANTFDGRSTSKGPEPEGVTIGKAYGTTLAFITLERIGGVVVYDISNPYEPELVDYVNNRNFASPFNFATAGDLGPEGVTFINADDSPNGKPLVVVGHEISGTTTIYQINKLKKKN